MGAPVGSRGCVGIGIIDIWFNSGPRSFFFDDKDYSRPVKNWLRDMVNIEFFAVSEGRRKKMSR
jgi:hypothetical protein